MVSLSLFLTCLEIMGKRFEICIYITVFNIEKYNKKTLFNNLVLYYH